MASAYLLMSGRGDELPRNDGENGLPRYARNDVLFLTCVGMTFVCQRFERDKFVLFVVLEKNLTKI